jgi:hypothetical protein
VPDYRFYVIKMDGHIAGPPKTIDLPSDEAAVKGAKALLDDRTIEIWQGSRVVCRLEPK